MFRVRFHYITFLILPCLGFELDAQNAEHWANIYSSSVSGFMGKVLAHSDTLKPLTDGTVKGFRFSVSPQSNGGKAWHNRHGMPYVGIALTCIDLGNKRVLGNAWGIQPFISYQLLQFKNFSVRTDFGLGLAYITRKYSPAHNPTNVAISTSINYWATANLTSTFKFSNRFNLTAGIESNHFSNGAIKKPNYGLNIFGFSFGFTYTPEMDRTDNCKKEVCMENSDGKSQLGIVILAGIKETGPAGGEKYYPLSISMEYLMPLAQSYPLMAGLDIMFDKSTRFHIELSGKHYSPVNDDFQVGIKTGLQIPFNRLSLHGHFGWYLYNKNPRLPLYYQKLGIRYRLSRTSQVQLELKTHLNTADHVGVGYIFTL